MIHIQELSRHYGAVVALHDVNVEIQRGEVVGLLGANGAGKTTMMKTLTGYLEPSGGTVKVDGTDVVEGREAVQAQIGYLPENAPLYPEMLVADYLMHMAELRGVAQADCEQAVAEAAQAAGLVERLDAPIRTLSKGFRQRVGLAQAIVHKPSVLVLDEPTNGLDPSQILGIRQLIRRLGEKQDTTILLSTHILQEVEAVCDRVLVLIGGRLVADAPLSELLASDSVSLSVDSSGEDVVSAVEKVDGVVGVREEGPDEKLSGFVRWTVQFEGEQVPTAAIARAVTDAGWALGALTPESRTLESVFRDLQAQVATEVQS